MCGCIQCVLARLKTRRADVKTKENRISLLNELSFTYGDSLKYINEYIKTNCPGKYEVIFPIRNTEEKYDSSVITVYPMSLKYFYFLLTSMAIITNAGGISYLPIRKRQVVINTWHGGGPYKKTGTALHKNKWYRYETKMNASNVDYVLSSCKYFTRYEAKAMLYSKGKCISPGMPRNDIFFEDRPWIRKKVFNYAGIDRNEKIVLYAPTFRNNSGNSASPKELYLGDIDYFRVLQALTQRFGGKWNFAIRLHPKLKNADIGEESITNFTDYPDMQELLYAADAVITDYSSLIWDYSFTQRPCFLYADDIEQYEKERGFYMPIAKWPFPIAHNNDELESNISFFDEEDYTKKVLLHHKESGSFEHGCACKMTIDLIEKNCKTDVNLVNKIMRRKGKCLCIM